jgi:hypothetical protein
VQQLSGVWLYCFITYCCATMASRAVSAATITTGRWGMRRWGAHMAATTATRCSVDTLAQQRLDRNGVVYQAATIRDGAAVVVVRSIAAATLPKLETKIVKVPTMGDSITEVCINGGHACVRYATMSLQSYCTDHQTFLAHFCSLDRELLWSGQWRSDKRYKMVMW